MRFVTPFVLGIICLFCYSCSLKQKHVLFEQRTTTGAVTDTARASTANYRIKPDDILQIRNLQDYKYLAGESTGNSALASSGQSYQVDEDGKVTLPVIGHILVAGLTRTQAQNKVEELYKRDLLNKDAILELKVLNLKVTVLGEITAQGNYALTKDRTSLIDIIGQAGGLAKTADEKNVRIIRGPKQQEIKVDLSDISTIADPNIIMHDNDIVIIGQNKKAVRDEKFQSLTTIVQPSLLVFNTALIILTLFR